MFDIIHDYWVLMLVGQYPHGALGGLALTIILAVVSLIASFPLAIAIGLARTSPINAVRRAAMGYTYVIRAVPLLLLIFWTYFVVPLITGVNISGTLTMVVALVLYEGAYLGEVVRAGINAVPKGQVEAARAIGMGYWQTMGRIVLPQALFNMLPSILSQFILITKNTSLAYLIGTQEMTFAAHQINSQLLTKPFEVYALLAALYFILCFSLSRLAKWLEKAIQKKRLGTHDTVAVRNKSSQVLVGGSR
ncbi:TPA: amino acid ABC transporter permease [Pseudomonas putida]|nr:amino acid ABC transporter permease [Pseudomonas putida]